MGCFKVLLAPWRLSSSQMVLHLPHTYVFLMGRHAGEWQEQQELLARGKVVLNVSASKGEVCLPNSSNNPPGNAAASTAIMCGKVAVGAAQQIPAPWPHRVARTVALRDRYVRSLSTSQPEVLSRRVQQVPGRVPSRQPATRHGRIGAQTVCGAGHGRTSWPLQLARSPAATLPTTFPHGRCTVPHSHRATRAGV